MPSLGAWMIMSMTRLHGFGCVSHLGKWTIVTTLLANKHGTHNSFFFLRFFFFFPAQPTHCITYSMLMFLVRFLFDSTVQEWLLPTLLYPPSASRQQNIKMTDRKMSRSIGRNSIASKFIEDKQGSINDSFSLRQGNVGYIFFKWFISSQGFIGRNEGN